MASAAPVSSPPAEAADESGDTRLQSLICPLCKRKVMIVINIKENWTKFYTLTSESDGDGDHAALAAAGDEYQQERQQQNATDSANAKRTSRNDQAKDEALEAESQANPQDSEYTMVKCTSCDKSIGLVFEDGRVRFAEEILKDPTKTVDGWTKKASLIEQLYSSCANSFTESVNRLRPLEGTGTGTALEVEYALPPRADLVKLLWINGIASGFYSMKLKGTLSLDTMETYSMPTLDTIFIRRDQRRRGHASAALQDILTEFPEQNIGFSYPISYAMEKVLSKHLEEHEHGPQNRLRFWEISGCGTQGNCRNLWLNLQKSRKKK